MSGLWCGKLVHDTRDVRYTYKGQVTVLPHVAGDFVRRVRNRFWMRRSPAARWH